MPAYKIVVGAPDNHFVEDYTGTRRRPATPSEANRLPFRTVVAPVRLELALQASLGEGPWHEEFDLLRPHGPRSREVFDD